MRLLLKALAYNLDTYRANPANLIAGALGMVVNNGIVLVGMWGMLFAGKVQNQPMLMYFVALTAVVMGSFGFVNFFFGGLRVLGDDIVDGVFESTLATPRDPLMLSALSQSRPASLGDLLMGLAMIGGVGVRWGLESAFACVAALGVSVVGVMALFIIAGSVAFFVPRGNNVGYLLIEVFLALSWWPSGKLVSGWGRLALLLTPAAVIAVLPLEVVELPSARTFGLAAAAALGFLGLSVVMFRRGLRRYQSVSLVGTRA